MFRKIYIHVQLICIAKTRNGKLVSLAWKQPLQEELDIDSEESDLHALNIICDTHKDNDEVVLILWMKKIIGENVNNKTIQNIYVMKIFVPIPSFS